MLFALALAGVVLGVEPFRDFRNNQGQVTNARLVGIKDDQVAIQTKDGKTYVIPIYILSLPDQLYIREAAKRGGLLPSAPPDGSGGKPPGPGTPEPVAPVDTDPGTIDFAKHVLPIFEKLCNDCHKAPYEKNNRVIKPKAGLRLDSYEATMKGSADGLILKPGKPDDSLLYELIALDPDEDDVMPPKGDPLTPEQIETIRKWIAEGARSSIDAASQAGGKGTIIPAGSITPLDKLAANLNPLPESAIAAAAKTGAMIMPLAVKHPFLRVEFISRASNITDSELSRLTPIRNNVTQLDLSKTKITDKGLRNVAGYRHLTHLNLRNTQVGDAGLAFLRNMENLWYLNLLNTKVTDRGLTNLMEIKGLQEVYLWQSKVTKEGVKRLREALPNAKISF